MGMQMSFPEDSIIIRENSNSQYMYIVVKGTIALYMNYKKKNEYLLGLCSKGKTFGELGVLCHEKSTYTAVATDDVAVVAFSENELENFVKKYPLEALGVMRNMARMNNILNLNLKMVMSENEDSGAYDEIVKKMVEGKLAGTPVKPTWRSTR